MLPLADWLEKQQQTHPSAIDLDLERVGTVARRLELLTPSHRVITVAGTNGKGSTVAYLDCLLRGAGLRVGRFTSPHLLRYNERICIDGVPATDEQLVDSFERIEQARGTVSLTFFEYNTLAAFDRFQRAAVDVAVLEVGLGGRLDATNVLDADVAVLCSVGLDHVEWLGASLDEIGREKAGIFRRGRPAVLGSSSMPGSVWTAIDAVGALAVAVGRDFHVAQHANGWDFDCNAVRLRNLPRPALAGAHQIGNAATALAALAAGDFGVELDVALVSQALRATRLPGRFQVETGAIEWVLDVAHNVPAAAVLAAGLRTLPRARRTIAVCGILADKDIAGIAATLAGEVDDWILITLPGPRGLDADALAARLPPGANILGRVADVPAACALAHEHAQSGDRVLVFGSFLTVGPALEYLGLY